MTAGQKRVVVVEDDAELRKALQRVLRVTGLAVTSFATAETALEDPRTQDARCLVLDVHLPGISGFELYERLSVLGSKSPVIFISARDDIRARERAAHVGALDYLVKPFSGRALAAIVARACP